MIYLYCIITFLISVQITKLAIKLSWKLDFLSHPNNIVASHKKPVAYLGGAAIMSTILLSYFIFKIHGHPIINFQFSNEAFACMLIMCLVGTLDDYYRFSPSTKLLMQLGAAICFVCFGFYAPITGVFFIDAAIAIFILIAMLNAFNLIDVCDGLLSIVFLPTLFYFIIFKLGAMSEIITGVAIIGFLCYNRPDAKIYLGDGGSHLLGGLAYILSVLHVGYDYTLPTLIQFILVFGVIGFEFFNLLYRRSRQGISIFKGSPDHYALLLQDRGWSKTKVITISFCISLLLVTVAILIKDQNLSLQLFVFVFYLILCLILGSRFKIYKH